MYKSKILSNYNIFLMYQLILKNKYVNLNNK